MERKQKSAKELLEALKSIRKRPIPPEQIEEHNRIIEKDDEHERMEKEKQKDRSRKIARDPEVDL